MALVLRRTALFVAIILLWVLFAAMEANAATHDVAVFRGHAPGTIVVKTHECRLYFVLHNVHAPRFPVGVGRPGMQWFGRAYVERKLCKARLGGAGLYPAGKPRLPAVIPCGASNNPMGVAAFTLRGGKYAIDSTDRP